MTHLFRLTDYSEIDKNILIVHIYNMDFGFGYTNVILPL